MAQKEITNIKIQISNNHEIPNNKIRNKADFNSLKFKTFENWNLFEICLLKIGVCYRLNMADTIN
jgi:hypothetical protein